MFAYKTNSADYLDYVASVKSRKEIMADPDLCLLLENPYIKDNMEMAIRWNEAKYGDYQDKYDFMEYFMCNGPQLDADTILHYRKKAYNDPVCMEIAYSYLSDTNHLAQVRQTKYNKETDNCFKNPCFYMGKFSAMMGSCGDSENTRSAFNMVGRWGKKALQNTKGYFVNMGKYLRGQISEKPQKPAQDSTTTPVTGEGQNDSSVPGSQTVADPAAKKAPQQGNADAPKYGATGGGRQCFQGGIIPSMKKGAMQIWAQISQGNETFTKELTQNNNTALNAKNIGDSLCEPVAELLDLVTKANVKRQLGDCSRLWSQVRRLRLFSSENKYGPIVASQIVGDRNTDGTPKQVIANPQPKASDASVNVAASKKTKSRVKKKKKKDDKKKDDDKKNLVTAEDGQTYGTTTNQEIVADNYATGTNVDAIGYERTQSEQDEYLIWNAQQMAQARGDTDRTFESVQDAKNYLSGGM